jgi:Zn finger protein HypA/HybF involved in hydrogenase expression
MMQKLRFICPECGGNVGLEVSIHNIFGKIRAALHTNKIEITFAGLLAKQVKITGKKFTCMTCSKDLEAGSILLICPYSGDRATIDNFIIMRATHKETEKKVRPVIIHKDHADKYIKDAEKSGHDVYKRTAKLNLNTEVGND